jgi:citrate lyase subunit alpha/citrate CoA-transferase
VVKRVNTIITPGSTVDVLVTDQGVAVNPKNPELRQRLKKAGITLIDIDALYEKAIKICGKPKDIAYSDKVVATIRYRDGSILDVVKALA